MKENNIHIKNDKPDMQLTPVDDTPIDSFGCLKETVLIKKDILAPIKVKWDTAELHGGICFLSRRLSAS